MERKMDSVILVDPIGTGEPFKSCARDMGLSVLSVMTITSALTDRMASVAPRSLDNDTIHATTVEEVLHAVQRRNLKVRAVVPATEPGVDLAESLSRHLELTGNTRCPGARRDKSKMREHLRTAGLSCPHFTRARNEAEVAGFMNEHGLPVVIKTPAGAGGSQVFICRNTKAALSQFEVGIRSRDIFGQLPEFLLLEQFIPGREFGVNIFVQDRHLSLVDVWEYRRIETPCGSPVILSGVQVNLREFPELDDILAYLDDVCEALGLTVGPAHAEVKWTNAGPVLIELGARLCGVRMPEMWQRFAGFNGYTITLRQFLGEKVHIPDRIRFESALAIALCPYLGTEAGEVVSILGVDEVRKLSSFVDWTPNIRLGQRVGQTRDLANNLGVVHLASPDREQLGRDLAFVQERIVPELNIKIGDSQPC
jgi:biotin carboxylase